MTKFFYFFLLNLLIFSGSHHSNALLSDPHLLDQIEFEVDSSDLKGVDNYNLQILDGGCVDCKSTVKRQLVLSQGVNTPYASFYSHNFQKYPYPANNIGVIEANPYEDKSPNKEELDEKLFPKTVTRWKDDVDLEDYRGRFQKWIEAKEKIIKKKDVSSRFKQPEKKRSYLDYTNSQMPFNEGKVKQKFQNSEKNRKFSEEKEKQIKNPELKKNFKRKVEKSLNNHLNTLDMPIDDAYLEYSRVRRFLDHQRAKKKLRVSSTLEAKEAAMSRILDPNLNSDGILEPHVRKRRGRSRKRDSSGRISF